MKLPLGEPEHETAHPLHSGSEQPRIGMEVLGHSLVCLLICFALLASLARSAALIRLLVRLFTHSLPCLYLKIKLF